MPDLAEKRPGEAIGCVHASDGPDGCGTGLHCWTCGAVIAVLERSITPPRRWRECRVLVGLPAGPVPSTCG